MSFLLYAEMNQFWATHPHPVAIRNVSRGTKAAFVKLTVQVWV